MATTTRSSAASASLRKGFELGGVRFHVVHQLPRARANDRTQVVMFGHSHRTLIELRGAVLYLNPGASGRVGFHKLQTVATISIEHGVVTESDIIELGPRQPRGGA